MCYPVKRFVYFNFGFLVIVVMLYAPSMQVTCETKSSPKASVISKRIRSGQSTPRRSHRAQSELVTKTYLSPEDNLTAVIAGNAAAARFEYAPRSTSPFSDVDVVVKRAVSPSPVRVTVRYPIGQLAYRQPYVSVRERRRVKNVKVTGLGNLWLHSPTNDSTVVRFFRVSGALLLLTSGCLIVEWHEIIASDDNLY